LDSISSASSRVDTLISIGQNATINDVKVRDCSFANVPIVIEASPFVIMNSCFLNNIVTSPTSGLVYVGNETESIDNVSSNYILAYTCDGIYVENRDQCVIFSSETCKVDGEDEGVEIIIPIPSPSSAP